MKKLITLTIIFIVTISTAYAYWHNEYPAETVTASDDKIMIYDASGATTKVMTKANFLSDFAPLDSPTLTTPALGIPSALVLTNATGLVNSGIVDDTINVSKLDIYNSETNGYYLQYDSTNGLQWAAASGSADDTAYGASWNSNTDAATKNAIYDKIETLSGGHDAVTLAGTSDYLTLSGQEITVGQPDLSTDVLGVLAAAQIDPAITRNADLGTAAALDVGTTIGDVVQVADVGYCSDTQYTDQTTCESNSQTWTPVAGLDMTAVNLPTAAGYQVGGVALTAADLGGATAAQGTHADTAYGWGDHAAVGYLTSESDPVFSAWNKDYADLINPPTIPTSGTDFDPVGTDNSTNVTIAAGRDYISISGQVLTLGAIDLTTDVTGLLPSANIAADMARDSEIPTNNNTLTNGAGYLTTESDPTAMAHIQTTLTATASNTFSAGSVGFISSAGTVTLADASAEATASNMLVIATGAIAGGSSGTFALSGLVTVTSHGYTLGAPLFLSETAGALTTTAPTTSTAIVRVVGYAVDANTIYLRDDSTYLEVQ